MSSPITALETALYTKLNVSAVTTLATGGVWNKIAPQGTALPYVIFQWQGGGDDNLTPRRGRNLIYTVKALAADADTAENIDEQIDLALHYQTLTVSGWTNYRMAREDDVNYQEEPTGVPVWHIGAMYRIEICA